MKKKSVFDCLHIALQESQFKKERVKWIRKR